MSDLYEDATAFYRRAPRGRAIAGLDLGTKTIGLALSDRLWSIATPQHILQRKKFTLDAAALIAWLGAREAGAIVLGLPRNMDASEGPRAQATRAFARNFQAAHPGWPLLLWDERLSTQAATRALLEADTSRARRKEVIDAVAAGVILQGALDRLGFVRAEEER